MHAQAAHRAKQGLQSTSRHPQVLRTLGVLERMRTLGVL